MMRNEKMKIFKCRVTEYLTKDVAIIAGSKEDARRILDNLYHDMGIITLDYEDYDDNDIDVLSELNIKNDDLSYMDIYDKDGNLYDENDLPLNKEEK